MPKQRRHLITGDPILFAPERAGRPNAFGDEGIAVCPFCPGHESMTPPEIERAGEPWRLRVFPNKYPSVPGHEVIVESPDHHASFDRLSNGAEAIETYVRRYMAHDDAAAVSLFTNHGRSAGASIDHLHSQLMPLPFVPQRLARETEAFARAASCPLCDAIEQHRKEDLVIDEIDGFVGGGPPPPPKPKPHWIG